MQKNTRITYFISDCSFFHPFYFAKSTPPSTRIIQAQLKDQMAANKKAIIPYKVHKKKNSRYVNFLSNKS